MNCLCRQILNEMINMCRKIRMMIALVVSEIHHTLRLFELCKVELRPRGPLMVRSDGSWFVPCILTILLARLNLQMSVALRGLMSQKKLDSAPHLVTLSLKRKCCIYTRWLSKSIVIWPEKDHMSAAWATCFSLSVSKLRSQDHTKRTMLYVPCRDWGGKFVPHNV